MTKFFYIFLLSLLLFSGRHVDARLSNLQTLDKIRFEIKHSDRNHLSKWSGSPHRRSSEVAKAPKVNSEASAKEYFGCSKEMEGPLSEYRGFRFKPYKNAGLDIDLKRKKLQLEEELFSKWCSAANCDPGAKKWRNALHRAREKRFLPSYASALAPDKPERFLDFTNSQMPFNEGQISEPKKSRVSGKAGNKKRDFSFDRYLVPKALPYRLGRAMRRRSEEKNFEMLRDDPVLEYSRVRRFLDHERAKKQARVSSTLEAKEAAMSGVLDPNLNSDGILEPHVRKRRGHTRKRDLSSKAGHLKNLRLRGHTMTYNKPV